MFYNIFLFRKISRIILNERSISTRTMTKSHHVPVIGSFRFMPKKPVIRVGGMKRRDTRVKIFIILFWSR